MRSVEFGSVEITKCDREPKAVVAECGGCRLWRLQTVKAAEREVCGVWGYGVWGLLSGVCGVCGLISAEVTVGGGWKWGFAECAGCRVWVLR